MNSPIFVIRNHQYLICEITNIWSAVALFSCLCLFDTFVRLTLKWDQQCLLYVSLQEMTKVFKILRQPCLYSLEQKITKFYPYYYAIKKLVSPERNIEGTQDSVQLCESQTSHYNVLKIWQRACLNLPVDWVSQLAFNFWPHKLITHSPYLLMAKWFNLFG